MYTSLYLNVLPCIGYIAYYFRTKFCSGRSIETVLLMAIDDAEKYLIFKFSGL